MPTPRPSRLSNSAASDPACLATNAGGRIGNLSTKKLNLSVVVAAHSAAAITNASTKDLPSRNSRLRSGV